MPDPHPRIALITGAARGIGAAIAQRLHHDGWRTFLVDSDADALQEQAGRLGAPAHPIVADIADEAAVTAVANRLPSTPAGSMRWSAMPAS